MPKFYGNCYTCHHQSAIVGCDYRFNDECDGYAKYRQRRKDYIKPDIEEVLSPDKEIIKELETKLKESQKRLLNAFQLVKNGKTIGHLKFDEFERLMDKKHDHNGDIGKYCI